MSEAQPSSPSARAIDPNTPLAELLQLVRAHPREVLENPVLPLLLLEDPVQTQELMRIARYARARLDLEEGLALADAKVQRCFAIRCAVRLLPFFEQVYPVGAPPRFGFPLWFDDPAHHPRSAISLAMARLKDPSLTDRLPYNDLFSPDEALRSEACEEQDSFCWKLPEGVLGIGCSYDYYRYMFSSGLSAAVAYCAASDHPERSLELVIKAIYGRAEDDLFAYPDLPRAPALLAVLGQSPSALPPREIGGQSGEWDDAWIEARVSPELERLADWLNAARKDPSSAEVDLLKEEPPIEWLSSTQLWELANRAPEEVLGHPSLALLSLEDRSQAEEIRLLARLQSARQRVSILLGGLSERVRRQFAVDCAWRVLPLFEAKNPGDTRPREAIEVAARFAAGEATQEELLRRCQEAFAAHEATHGVAASAAATAGYAAEVAPGYAEDTARMALDCFDEGTLAHLAEWEQQAAWLLQKVGQ